MKTDVIKYIKYHKEEFINKKLEKNKVQVQILHLYENEGIMIIRKNEIVDKVFVLRGSSQYQVDIFHEKELAERGVYVDDLSIWIYNLYNPVKYLYMFCDGRLNGQTLTQEQIESIAIGKTENMEEIRKNGGTGHRKELDNQPIVKGYLGPMFDSIDYGVIYLRYETQRVYDMASK